MSNRARIERPYTVREVADLLARSVQQVRTLFHAGDIPGGFQLKKLIRFQKDAVDRWLAERVKAGGTA